MGAGNLDQVILEERKPDGRWVFLGVPIKPGSLTVWPNEVGIVMRDGKVEDIFSEGKRKLPRWGEVRTYVVHTKPFDLTFWLKDPEDLKEPDEGVVLDQDLPVLTADGEVVTGRIGLTLSVVSSYEEHLLRLLRSGRSFVTERDVSDKIEPELLAKVLALDIYKYTAAELRGNREASGEIQESVSIEPAATIRRYGLRLDNFTVNWGLTSEERERIRKWRQEIAEAEKDGMKEEEIGYSFKNGKKSMQNVPDWVKNQIPKYYSMFRTTDSRFKKKSYYLDGKTFTYRIFFSRVHRGAELQVYRTLREK